MNEIEKLQAEINDLRRMVGKSYLIESPRETLLTAPLTSTSWDGDAYSTTAKTKIDLSAVFGAPANIKSVLLYISCRDSGSAANDTFLVLSPNDTANSGMVVSPYPVNDRSGRFCVNVPCDANGDIYYQISASGAGTFDVNIQIWGYTY